MGAFDFESAQDELLGIEHKSKLDFLFDSVPFLKTYAKSIPLTPSCSGSVLNRPVFYYTKLREEIYFINAKVISPNGFMYYTFAVNDKSFFRRFSIIIDTQRLVYNGEYTVDYIVNVIIKRNLAKVQLNIYGFENSLLKDCDEYIHGENKYLINGAYIEFNSIVHYNKRMWLYLFCNQEIKNDPNPANVTTELGDPNFVKESKPEVLSNDENKTVMPTASKEEMLALYNSDTGGHFDIVSEKRQKFAFFIQ